MPRRALSLALGLLTLLAAYTPRSAFANGRFPRAQQITSVPGDGQRLFLRATFGVLFSKDGGASWRWVCEQALGFTGAWDPPIAATKDGTLYVGLMDGLRSTVDGCSYADATELHGEMVTDLASDAAGLWAATSTPQKPAFLWRKRGAEPFRRIGKGLTGFYLDTLDASPSRPPRLYVTGVETGKPVAAHLFRSDDAGVTLTELHPKLPIEGRLFLAAIDPKDDKRILVRLLGREGSDLLLSTDAGESFVTALHMKGSMFGFARTSDGATVWAGSGDAEDGLYRSTDRGATFTPVAKTTIFCLHRSADKLLTCSNPFTQGGYAIGASTDDGVTVLPIAQFADIAGPVSCDGGAGEKCQGSEWQVMHATLTTPTSTPTVTTASTGDAATAPGDAAPTPAATRSARCGCAVIGRPAEFPRLPLSLPVLALIWRRWHRRRMDRSSSMPTVHRRR